MIPETLAGWQAVTGCTTSTYRVGLGSDLHRINGHVSRGRPDLAWQTVRRAYGYVVHQVRRRNWRAVRNWLNGWLCELDNDGVTCWATRCGRGWTMRAAQRDLVRHLQERATSHEPGGLQ